jgi:PIN domain nuclease of toxin-antitoxin system
LRLLLDTHVWLWRLLEPERISEQAESAISSYEGEIHLSPISVWEALILARKGRVSLEPSPTDWLADALRRSAPTAVPLTHDVALRSEALGGFRSGDPADRFLVATALEHDLALVTADGAMHAFDPVATIW